MYKVNLYLALKWYSSHPSSTKKEQNINDIITVKEEINLK